MSVAGKSSRAAAAHRRTFIGLTVVAVILGLAGVINMAAWMTGGAWTYGFVGILYFVAAPAVFTTAAVEFGDRR
ncbi:membrane protein [Gordonia phage SpeedDemon]|nr:membrane protein [Gordonia phage SpeedDemon]